MSETVKIQMLKTTNYFGLRVAGEVYEDIPEQVAKRWEANGICVIAETAKVLTAKELFDLCKEKNIVVDKEQIKGKSEEEKREYLISLIKE